MQSNVPNTETNATLDMRKSYCFNFMRLAMQQSTITKSIKDKDTK